MKRKKGSGKVSVTLSTKTQLSLMAMLLSDGGLRCDPHHPRPHRSQWSSAEDKRGKGIGIRIRSLRRIPEEGTNFSRGDRSGRYVQQFQLLIKLLVQYGISLTSIRWPTAALQEREVAMLLANWFSMPKQLTMGLPPHPPPPNLSPVLYNVYTKGLADLNSNGLSRVLTLADDGLIYKTANDTHTAVTAVQDQLGKVSQWRQETESEINPSKAQAL